MESARKDFLDAISIDSFAYPDRVLPAYLEIGKAITPDTSWNFHFHPPSQPEPADLRLKDSHEN